MLGSINVDLAFNPGMDGKVCYYFSIPDGMDFHGVSPGMQSTKGHRWFFMLDLDFFSDYVHLHT